LAAFPVDIQPITIHLAECPLSARWIVIG